MDNLMIFPAGTEIAFEINNALKYSKFVNIFGATSVDDHSAFVYKNLITGLPYVTNEKFIKCINEQIAKYDIRYIYPAHDIAIDFFAEHESEINAVIISSPYETVKICRSKERTYNHLKEFDFIPRFYQYSRQVENFPVFVKPKEGQGSVGAKKINSMDELDYALHSSQDELIICEYLAGTEYSIDCFTDKDGNLKSAIMRDRARIRTGISVRSTSSVTSQIVQEIANNINSKLIFNGAWFFQLKCNSIGEYKLLEISPRIPGTMGCSRVKGINYPLLTLYNNWGYSVDVSPNEYQVKLDRAFISRYKLDIDYDTAYVDFDDTIIVNDKVNLSMIMLLYQMKNNNKKIILITRHAKDIRHSLNEYNVDASIFDNIIHIKDDKRKSEYMLEKRAIFIDDSFKERKDVMDNINIPVFDLDAVEALLDWRI